MNEGKLREKDKILRMVEKYRDYFREWNADVAFGVNGRNIFYVLAGEKEMETFVFFQTAEQLEKIILGTLAENLDVILGAGIDEVNVGFTTENADGKTIRALSIICQY